jgi:hypothetical protein
MMCAWFLVACHVCYFTPTEDITAYETAIVMIYMNSQDCNGIKNQYPDIYRKYIREGYRP